MTARAENSAKLWGSSRRKVVASSTRSNSLDLSDASFAACHRTLLDARVAEGLLATGAEVALEHRASLAKARIARALSAALSLQASLPTLVDMATEVGLSQRIGSRNPRPRESVWIHVFVMAITARSVSRSIPMMLLTDPNATPGEVAR